MIAATVEELTPLIGTRPACRALGASPATIYRRRRPPEPKPPRLRPTPERALTGPERERVLEVLHSERFIDVSPEETWATLLDEGTYLCSPRTMYRILAAHHRGVRERRNQLTHPAQLWNGRRPALSANVARQRAFALGFDGVRLDARTHGRGTSESSGAEQKPEVRSRQRWTSSGARATDVRIGRSEASGWTRRNIDAVAVALAGERRYDAANTAGGRHTCTPRVDRGGVMDWWVNPGRGRRAAGAGWRRFRRRRERRLVG
jgi:hypothetical protein